MSEAGDPFAGHRDAEKATRAVLDEVRAGLRPGRTEREAARQITRIAAAHGADGEFHPPVVLFGERTAPRGARGAADLLPSDRALRPDEPVILDAAPLWGGVPGDVSATYAVGTVPELSALHDALDRLWGALPGFVEAGATARELARWIDAFAESNGLASCRESYLFGAVGHRVPRLGPGVLRSARVFGIGLLSATFLAGSALAGGVGLRRAWPFVSDHRAAQVPVGRGLWSIEPHLRLGSVGAKREGVLVRTEDGAAWLAGDPARG